MTHAFRTGLIAPGVVAVATAAAWAMAGPVWALGVMASGAGAVIGFHLLYIQRVTEWARGAFDAPVPEGRGPWAEALSALHRRMRTRTAYQRDLKLVIERFRRAAEAIPDGVVVLDETNRIAWANPRAEEQLGLDLATDRHQPIVNLVRQPEFLQYLEAGDYSESMVVPSHRDGRRTLSLQLAPFGIREKLLLSRDVTQLEAVARMRRDFIANVSHELKTPLTVISGFVETLQDLDLDAGHRARYLQLMAEQSRNMQRLVSDLITLSALESEQNPLHDTEFAIVPLLLEVSAEARALSRSEHTVTLEVGDAATVTGSREELASAFGNLVSNAIRYTPAGGTVTLSWRVADDGSGEFGVEDSGIGIAAEHIPRLTERFYRVDRSRSRATGGTGLGLAIVKHVLLRHDAELDVTSEPGRGSTFTVRLPARRVQRVVSTETAAASVSSATSS
jgi:two-component system phosphate regulon sensor histidine kinase PhoR